MPAAPAPQARRGTAFHAWLEERFGAAKLVDLDELPGITHWIPEQAPEELARAVLDRVARGPLLHPAAGTHAPPSRSSWA